MKVSNTTDKVKIHQFQGIKFNKHDTIFQRAETNPKESFITDLVKIERFQGYSKAYNLGLYFRIRNASSWNKSEQITGLWKTNQRNIYFGDRKTKTEKTLLLFKLCEEYENLTVYEFPIGYYPSRNTIDSIIQDLSIN